MSIFLMAQNTPFDDFFVVVHIKWSWLSFFLFELKGWSIVADIRTHRCYDDLQAELIAIATDQMGAQFNGAESEFVVGQQVVYVENSIDAREIVGAYVNRSDVRYLILNAGDEDADLVGKKCISQR